MGDYSADWEQYNDLDRRNISEEVELLARFYTHLKRIPGEEGVSSTEWKKGKFADTETLYDGFPLEELDEEYRELVENVRKGEGFSYRETAGLYLLIGTEIKDLQQVRSILNGVESSGATATNLRKLGELTEKALESKN